MAKNKPTIILIEDDELFSETMVDFLEYKYNIIISDSAEKARDIINKNIPDLVLLDEQLPGMNGIEMLQEIKSTLPDLPVIMLTATGEPKKIVAAIKSGAHNYLTKPINGDELEISIENAIESSEIRSELKQRRDLQLLNSQKHRIIGDNLESIKHQIKVVGNVDTTVLIEGETGTGKELVARAIHANSDRKTKPFVAINCGALPHDLIEAEFFGHKKGAFTSAQTSEIGKFSLANKGTLFLDEIGELPLEAQGKLLRVLEEREFYPVGSNKLERVDVRVVASTNRNLETMSEQKRFREDLYFRLNVCYIRIPPLRERGDDIIKLTEFFIEKFNKKFRKKFESIDKQAKELLLNYGWKGNVRELRNIIERVILFEDNTVLKKEHLLFLNTFPVKNTVVTSDVPAEGLDLSLEKLEKDILTKALSKTKGNKSKAAKLLKLSAPSFYYRLEKYNLD